MVAGTESTVSFSISSRTLHPTTSMSGKVGSKSRMVITNYFASSSEEEQDLKEVANLQTPDFEPFFASFRKYRKELSASYGSQTAH